MTYVLRLFNCKKTVYKREQDFPSKIFGREYFIGGMGRRFRSRVVIYEKKHFQQIPIRKYVCVCVCVRERESRCVCV